MSIFSQVAKSVLLDQILQQNNHSIQEDETYKSRPRFVAFVLPERNLELAQEKRDLLNGLKKKIMNYQDQDAENDLVVTRTLLFYLEKCKTDVIKKAQAKKREEGTTEKVLDDLIKFMKDFHKMSVALKIVEKPHDKDAFSYFAIAIASYQAKRILDEIQDVYGKFKTFVVAFHQELDRVVNNTWLDALDNIDGQIQDDETKYKKRKNKYGARQIDYLILKNEQIWSNHSCTRIPKLLLNYLNTYLKAAESTINGQETTEVFSIEDEDDFTMYETTDALRNRINEIDGVTDSEMATEDGISEMDEHESNALSVG